MKKKLEADLISIAHRILKLKGKSDLIQLHQETQKLYEKLSVLLFVEEHLGEIKPTIGISEIEKIIENAMISENVDVSQAELKDEQNPSNEFSPEVVVSEEQATIEDEDKKIIVGEIEAEYEEVEEQQTSEIEETIIEDEHSLESDETLSGKKEEDEEIVAEELATEEVKSEETTFKPAFELSFDLGEESKEEAPKTTSSQITFDDLLGPDYVDPVFVKPEELAAEIEVKDQNNVIPIARSYNDSAPVISINNESSTNTLSVNDRMAKGIIIGLNDRIAFMNHLFANSSEDYNRVLSQLMTFNSIDEARDFIENIVKPDYNNWEGKEEYAERFMEIVEKRFS